MSTTEQYSTASIHLGEASRYLARAAGKSSAGKPGLIWEEEEAVKMMMLAAEAMGHTLIVVSPKEPAVTVTATPEAA